MELDSTTCSECDATDWNKILENDYPERRKERERTVESIYQCKECGAEGKHFEHNSGSDTLSGAMR